MRELSRFRRHDGQTMTEYAVILAVITSAIVAAFALLSDAFVDRLLTLASFLG